MDGKRAANGSHADEPDQKKAKTEAAGKPALNLVRCTMDLSVMGSSPQIAATIGAWGDYSH